MSDEYTDLHDAGRDIAGRDSGTIVQDDSLSSALSETQHADLLLFTYRAAICLGCVLTVAVFYWDFYAQTHRLPYVLHDWMVGYILLPFGGAIWSRLKRSVKKKG